MDEPHQSAIKESVLRPTCGWEAWQITLGYMSAHHSPDATLRLEVRPDGNGLTWKASLSWGQKQELVPAAESIAAALSRLWEEVERNHQVFIMPEDASRAPIGYSNHAWLSKSVQATLQRLIGVAKAAFGADWVIMIWYRPAEAPGTRIQVRLLVDTKELRVGGRGPSILDALRDVLRNAASTTTFTTIINHDS